MTKMTISPIGKSDYNELLLQAVAEIENAIHTVSVVSLVSGVIQRTWIISRSIRQSWRSHDIQSVLSS